MAAKNEEFQKKFQMEAEKFAGLNKSNSDFKKSS